MSQVKVSGNASGTGVFEIAAPNTNTNYTLTLPESTGALVSTNATQTLTNKTWSSPASSTISSGTAQSPTSGTSVDFTGIPSWARRVTVMFNNVLFSTSVQPWIQLGDAGGIENTGYFGFCSAVSTAANNTNGVISVTAAFPLYPSVGVNNAEPLNGSLILTNLTGNIWTVMGNLVSGSRGTQVAGSKTLSDTLTQVRLTTSAATATFTTGTINIFYE